MTRSTVADSNRVPLRFARSTRSTSPLATSRPLSFRPTRDVSRRDFIVRGDSVAPENSTVQSCIAPRLGTAVSRNSSDRALYKDEDENEAEDETGCGGGGEMRGTKRVREDDGSPADDANEDRMDTSRRRSQRQRTTRQVSLPSALTQSSPKTHTRRTSRPNHIPPSLDLFTPIPNITLGIIISSLSHHLPDTTHHHTDTTHHHNGTTHHQSELVSIDRHPFSHVIRVVESEAATRKGLSTRTKVYSTGLTRLDLFVPPSSSSSPWPSSSSSSLPSLSSSLRLTSPQIQTSITLISHALLPPNPPSDTTTPNHILIHGTHHLSNDIIAIAICFASHTSTSKQTIEDILCSTVDCAVGDERELWVRAAMELWNDEQGVYRLQRCAQGWR